MQKTRKRFDGEQEKNMDRLPDDILVHILSFMSTRDCVQSSILGERWRSLWARVPNLEFDSRDHKTVRSFSNFVNRFVFIHKGQNINTFRLVHEEYDNKLEVETLIAAAIACNVQVIEIVSDSDLMLPRSIYTCKTLVGLTLDGYLENPVPMTGTTVFFPALEKLELRHLGTYGYVKTIVHLLSEYPALEELKILKTDCEEECFYVSSPTITRLDLKIQFDEDDEQDKDFELNLYTPALKYLKLRDYLSEDFTVGMLASLTEADVFFDAFTDRAVRDILLYSRSVLEFVGKLNNVICLKLETNWKCIGVPDSAFSAFTTKFRNLTKLELLQDQRFVTIFLENSDNLEVLTINMDDNLQYWMEPKQVPVCLIYHLGTVRFFDFKCSEPEFNMVEYILRNAKVLKRMEIHIPCYHLDSIDDLKKKYEAPQRISMFERASEACQLAFG